MTSNSPSNLPFAAAGAADLRVMVAIASSLIPEKRLRHPSAAIFQLFDFIES
jgi:hypothetical protein